MAKITGINGNVYEAETLMNTAKGKSYLNGSRITNAATGENFEVSGVEGWSKEALYSALRDDSWLPMVNPEKNEIYMLMHLYSEYSLIAFSVTGGDYTVELGSVKNGKFVSDESKKEILAGGTKYENKLYFDDFSDAMDDGGRQCMIKVSGENITKFEICSHSEYGNSSFIGWNIVEIWSNLPEATTFFICDTEGATDNNLNMLAFLKIVGENKITKLSFANLVSLRMVLEYQPSVNTNSFAYIGRNCRNLLYFPKVKIVKDKTSFHFAFYSSNVKKLSFEDFNKVNTMSSSAFSGNNNLEEIEGLDTSSVITDISIYNCPKLKKLEIDTSSMNGAFRADNNYSMHTLLFKSSNGNSPSSISLINTGLSREGLCEMFNSLPYTATAKSITITGVMGAGELSENDIDIATAKGWSVVI